MLFLHSKFRMSEQCREERTNGVVTWDQSLRAVWEGQSQDWGNMKKYYGLLGAIFIQAVSGRAHQGSNQQLASLQESLDVIYQDHLQRKMTQLKADEIPQLRERRNSQFPKITRKKKKVRTCQNMAGIIGRYRRWRIFLFYLLWPPGGTNAFNFINFVAAVVRLLTVAS